MVFDRGPLQLLTVMHVFKVMMIIIIILLLVIAIAPLFQKKIKSTKDVTI